MGYTCLNGMLFVKFHSQLSQTCSGYHVHYDYTMIYLKAEQSLIATFMYYDVYMSVALAAQGIAAVYSCCADMGNRNHFSLVTIYILAIE